MSGISNSHDYQIERIKMNEMKTRKIVRIAGLLIVVGVLIAGGVAFYLFNLPHRDVAKAKVDYEISANQLVNEYLTAEREANEKYLSSDGDSKVLAVKGVIKQVQTDLKGQTVVLLQSNTSPAGVRVTLNQEIDFDKEKLKEGVEITLKGVIRSGAAFDEDMEIYRDAVLDKGVVL